jgi:hypothetical protein
MPAKTPSKTKTPNKTIGAKRAGDGKAAKRRDGAWDERLRLTGDARFVEVEWSGRDYPSWPLPKK